MPTPSLFRGKTRTAPLIRHTTSALRVLPPPTASFRTRQLKKKTASKAPRGSVCLIQLVVEGLSGSKRPGCLGLCGAAEGRDSETSRASGEACYFQYKSTVKQSVLNFDKSFYRRTIVPNLLLISIIRVKNKLK